MPRKANGPGASAGTEAQPRPKTKRAGVQAPNYWEVVVGNVGFVYEGTNGFKARALYNQYVNISATHESSRAYNESVTLFKNGDIHKSYDPPMLGTGESDA